MKKGVIYRITNKINGKVYIGQTSQKLSKRLGFHRTACSAIGNAIRRYGLDCFSITVIDHAESKEELDEKEIHYIWFYSCKAPNGYNLTDGGYGRRGNGTVHSLEWKKKISESLKGHSISDETRKLWSRQRKGKLPWNKGIPCSDDVKAKISQANLGKVSYWKGKKMPREMVEKMRQTKTGLPSPKKGKHYK